MGDLIDNTIKAEWTNADALDLQPTYNQLATDCTECEEYDTERHFCPKYCEVIRKTVEEAKQERTGQWIQNDNGTWSCNRCSSWIPDEQHYYANWCLFCGAHMVEEGEG